MDSSSNNSGEIEIESKKIQIGEKFYFVDMKENRRGKFVKLVEGLGAGKMSRIIIPVNISAEFLLKLKDILQFIDKGLPETERGDEQLEESNQKFPVIIKSDQMFLMGRRLYFDLREHFDGFYRLRISHVLKAKRINFTIIADAVKDVVAIIEDYVQTYAENVEEMEQSYSKPFSPSYDVDTKKEKTRKPKEPRSVHLVKKLGLVVLEKPAVTQHAIANKSYMFESVAGEQSMFVRVTELIGNSKKSIIHIPLEGCKLWKEAVVKFVDQITSEDIAKAFELRTKTEALRIGSAAK